MNVFHGLVNYGTQAGLIAKGLREFGVNAKSYVMPDNYQREADFQFKHGGNIIRKIIIHLFYNPWIKVQCLFKYDIFHFYYGTSLLPFNLDLPIIKLLGKKIVHHYLGYDVELYQETKDKYEFSNMDWIPLDKGRLRDERIKKRLAFEQKYSDVQIVCAPQYSPFVPNSIFIPLAIDLNNYLYSKLLEKDYNRESVKILHAPTHRGIKGTTYLEKAVKRLKSEGWNVELKICEGISHKELMDEYKKCDFYVVSLLGGWYGTAAIEAMAVGRGVVGFLRDEYFDYTDFKQAEIPIVKADKLSIYEVLKKVLRKKEFVEWGRKSREFVENVHDLNVISKKIFDIYTQLGVSEPSN